MPLGAASTTPSAGVSITSTVIAAAAAACAEDDAVAVVGGTVVVVGGGVAVVGAAVLVTNVPVVTGVGAGAAAPLVVHPTAAAPTISSDMMVFRMWRTFSR
jgi:hypothetical protein